jgi:hypothetical protein
VLRSADERTISGLVLGSSGTAWTRRVHEDAQVALARYAVIIIDRDPDRVIALDPATGAELVAVHGSAKVAAAGPAGLILVDRREVGYVLYAGGGRSDGGPGGPPGGGPSDGPSDGPGGGPGACTGPKKEVCPPGEQG